MANVNVFQTLIIFTLLIAYPMLGQQIRIQTSAGAIAGIQTPGSHVISFKGIPFAAPPVGELRWKPPASVHAWKGVRDAGTFGASCMQRIHDEFLPWTPEFLTHNRVSEDCLYLNVWTPDVSGGGHLPAIVFIHGGGFVEGSGDVAIYEGEHLASTGLVIVTINYRLGVFGFLAHPELTAESNRHSSGNYALLDQIAALQWVKNNISNFGGDPDRVTIWGQSAGAFSVSALIASPLASGLFQRAVADSGIGLVGIPMPDLSSAEKAGVSFASAHHAASIEELRRIPAAELLPAPRDSTLRFVPDIDGWVLPDSPAALSARGADNDVPIITGYQANDGLLFIPPNSSLDAVSQLLKKQYGDFATDFEKLYPAKTVEDSKRALIEGTRDRDRVSMFLWASRREKNHRQPVFTYFFDRAIPWPQHPEFGAFHSGELPYFFSNLDKLHRPWEKVDHDLSRLAASYLKNFAATGNPNGAGVPNWRPVESGTPATMEVGSRVGPMPLADKERTEFWVRFFDSPQAKHAAPF